VHTTVDGGLPSNHIADLATSLGSSYAITTSLQPRLSATGSGGNGWGPTGPVTGAKGPLKSIRGGDNLLVIDSVGTVFISRDGPEWERPDLPAGLPDEGWKRADLEGDTLALTNGTGIFVVDLLKGDYDTIKTPPVKDLDLEGDKLAYASYDFPDVYNLTTRSWLDINVTDAIASKGSGWVKAVVEASELTAVTFGGIVMEVDVSVPSTEDDVKLLGSLPDDLGANVTDMVMLANDTVLLSTMKGNWVIDGGEAMPFSSSYLSMPRSNDVMSVRWDADTLWTLTPEGISMLTFDSSGLPKEWTEGPDLEKGDRRGRLDSAILGGTVYLAGAGDGIVTYDTFASSKPSRWNRTHVYGDGTRDTVEAVAEMGGRLYTGDPYGIDMMALGSDPPSFQPVDGAPKDVHCLWVGTGGFWAGTDTGLWNYNSFDDEWLQDRGLGEPLPEAPVLSFIESNGYPYSTIEGILWWLLPHFDSASKTLSHTDNITRVAARPDVDAPSPIWTALGGKGIAYIQSEAMEFFEPGRDGMGDAIVRDVGVGPDGIAYLATDSGLHRVSTYRTTWYDWTTSNGPSANDIRALEMRPYSDDLWVGAYGGVDVFDTTTTQATRYGTEDGIPSNQV
ncbi:MAG: hypothetical protein KAQ96_00725, partial [Thermoplasmata archaeon]|nr:hypothetical protein [Thermoplasmata archaeon]